jgi:hypothetical protein
MSEQNALLTMFDGPLNTKVLGAFVDHLAIYLPQTIPSLDDFVGVR